MPPAPLSLELKDDRPSFCRSVGWPGVGLYVLAFAVAGAHLESVDRSGASGCYLVKGAAAGEDNIDVGNQFFTLTGTLTTTSADGLIFHGIHITTHPGCGNCMPGDNAMTLEVVNEGGKASIIPLKRHGVGIMSMGFMLEDDQAVVWRGPMLAGAVNQFVNDVDWGDLDYLCYSLCCW